MTVTPVKAWADDASGVIVYYIDGKPIMTAAGLVPLAILGDYARGSIIVGGAAEWEDLTIGAVSTHLESDGTDIAWQQNITMADDAWIGIASNDLRIEFDPTDGDVMVGLGDNAGSDEFQILDSGNAVVAYIDSDGNTAIEGDFSLASGLGIIHADGVTAGFVLRADGMRYVPANPALTSPIAPVAQGDLIIADGTPAWSVLTLGAAAGYALVTTATTAVWDQTPTWTGDHSWISSTSTKPELELQNTNADAAASRLDFYKNSTSPADDDNLGAILFFGETSTGAKERYAIIVSQSLDVTNGDTGGGIRFEVVMDATERNLLEITGYNGVVNQGEFIINQDGQDVDFRVEALGVADALQVQGDDGEITLGALGAGFVQSTAGGVLSSAAILVGDLPAHAAEHEIGGGDLVDHDNLTNFVANEHIDHTGVTITAGAGLTGGGDISANRTIDVGAGNGITVNANDVALTTPGTLTVATGNVAAGNHTHAITTSSSGTSAVILATDANGTLRVDRFGVGTAASAVDGTITLPDNGWVGFSGGGQIVFDNQATDEINFMNCFVGINDATPTRRLDVSGGGVNIVAAFRSSDPDARISLVDDTTTNDTQVGVGATGDDLNLYAGALVEVTIKDGGDVGISDPSPDARLDVSDSDAVTNAVVDVLILEKLTSGTAAADFGAGILYQLEDAGGTSRDAGRLAVLWQDAGATETAEFKLQLNRGGTLFDAGVIVCTDQITGVGDQRGVGAVDLQSWRDVADPTQVASGDHSFIAGGARNTASGDYSFAQGILVESTHYGEHSFGAGANGFRRNFLVFDTVTHNDATWRDLYLDGTADAITLPNDSAWSWSVRVVGVTSGLGVAVSFHIIGLAKNDGGTTTMPGPMTVGTSFVAEDGNLDAQVVIDDPTDTLIVQVMDSDGDGQVVRWYAIVDVTYVEYP
jgi:hypothetical protein